MLFSNEIVFRGHPDKVCDQIAGAILDYCLLRDKNTRCGVEVVGGKKKIFITGEITTTAKLNRSIIKRITKRVLKDAGYKTNYKIIVNISKQSADIALGVDKGGAGDQGMMYGYATKETKEMLPLAIVILQKFAKWYDEERKQNKTLRPDGKAQITGVYDEKKRLQRIQTFLVSYQNDEKNRLVNDGIIKNKIKELCNCYNIRVDNIIINPTGRFEIGGLEGDSGLTGRKIVVDTYEGFAKVGGGSLNGKDPSKVDLSGTYKARQIAVRVLKKYNLSWCEVQLSYAIGLAEPLAIYINSDKGEISADKVFYKESTPRRIISDLRLRSLSYERQAQFGHFKGERL